MFALLLCGSCSKDDDEDLSLREPFLGRWELIAEGHEEDNLRPVEEFPNGIMWIIDFRPDGTQYNYRRDHELLEKEYYRLFYMNFYRVDSKYLYYNYDYYNKKAMDALRFRSEYEYEISENQLKLHKIMGRFSGPSPNITWFLYQRISDLNGILVYPD